MSENDSSGTSSWSTSISMLDDMKRGKSDSWRSFVHLYTPLIYSWCRRANLQESDAADVTQDVFRAVVAGFDGLSYGGIDDSFRGWLWTITRNELAKCFSKYHQSPNVIGGSSHGFLAQLPDWINDETCPDDPTAEAEVVRRAAELIKDDFEPHTWQAFWLFAVEDMPMPEIAKRLEMSPGAIRQAKFRVLARLREFLGFQ